MKMSIMIQAAAFCSALLSASFGSAQRHPKVLVLITSADKFADGSPTGLWLEEFAVPYETLAQGGAEMTVVSPKGGKAPIDPRSKATPEQEKEWKNAEKVLGAVQPLSSSIKVTDFDALFIPGGHGPLFDLATDPEVAELISEFGRSGKPVAAVCHGPAALVGATLTDGAPLVKGKKLTAFSDSEEKAVGLESAVPFSVQQKLIALGASYSQGSNFAEYAFADGTLITGQNPGSSKKVALLLLEQLNNQKGHTK